MEVACGVGAITGPDGTQLVKQKNVRTEDETKVSLVMKVSMTGG